MVARTVLDKHTHTVLPGKFNDFRKIDRRERLARQCICNGCLSGCVRATEEVRVNPDLVVRPCSACMEFSPALLERRHDRTMHRNVVTENHRLVVSNWVGKLFTDRITLTAPVLSNAACVMFLVNGDEKAEMVRRALKDPAANLPCQKVGPDNGELLWYLDKGAALKL